MSRLIHRDDNVRFHYPTICPSELSEWTESRLPVAVSVGWRLYLSADDDCICRDLIFSFTVSL